MKDKLVVWSILLALMIISILPGFVTAQVVSGSVNTPSGYSIDGTTGNLIPYDSSLKTDTGIWTSTSGSSSGWVPYGSPQGSFSATDGYTFSYVGEELGISGVSLSSFAHGYQNTSAVFVTGFMYGLKYRFPCANSIGGSCTDTSGPQDTLRVEVGYYPATGAPTFYLHQLGLKNQTDGNSAYNPNWQQLAETVTFSGAKTLAQAGAVNMGIYGQDAGFWACLMPDCYGPQVKDAYIRANYSVDPCILNPAYSPSCPGFNTVVQSAQSPLLWYSYNIAQRLPHIGGGVQVHGFDYGFGYYAGDYCTNTFMFWCTSSSGANGGTITLRITDSNNNELFKDSQYREGNYSGGGYSNRYLFTETQNSLSLGNVQWYATNVWGGNFQWSAWTRPIWSPDPCYEQPLYSKNCSNFDAEIKRLAALEQDRQEAALASTVATVTNTSSAPGGSITTTIKDPHTTNTEVTVATNPPPDRPPPTPDRPPSPPPPLVNTAPAPREELRELQQPKPDSSSRTVTRPEVNNDSTALALNLVRQNQQREIAIAQQASQGAIQTANFASSTSIRQAESIALESARAAQLIDRQDQQTITDVVTNPTKQDQTLVLGPQPGSTSIVNIAQQPRQQQLVTDTSPQQVQTSTSAVVVFNAMQTNTTSNVQEVVLVQSPTVIQTQPAQQFSYQPSQQAIAEAKPQVSFQQDNIAVNNQNVAVQLPQQTTEIQQVQLQVVAIAPAVSAELPVTSVQLPQQLPVVTVDLPQIQQSFSTDRTNPLNTILETKPSLQLEESKETKTASVNQKTEDSTLASGVSISAISVVPVGFNAYTIALADASFYQPKEIYRNQRTVDNRRALQNLRSDQLHEQMINQQWR